jgi:SAM-dependent methyltransferase
MQSSFDSLEVGAFPRKPFLAHSESLLQLLLLFAPSDCSHVLEIGCGPCSPLLPMLWRRWPDVDVHQIDARREVVLEAVKHNRRGRVEQMLASDMPSIATGSKQLVVAMSVFDQNAEDLLPSIAREVHRVLAPGGAVVYLHNEELNLPSTAASFLRPSAGEVLLLPSDRWRPGNDLEYCSGPRSEIEAALQNMSESAGALVQYLQNVYPQLYNHSQASLHGFRQVSAAGMGDYSFSKMNQIRLAVAQLRERHGVRLDDYHTTELLRNHIERGLFCREHGFAIERSGIFEIRRTAPWRSCFRERPAAECFVRGTVRFGYAGHHAPPPVLTYEQELNRDPVPGSDEVLFIGYQYGMVARKIEE